MTSTAQNVAPAQTPQAASGAPSGQPLLPQSFWDDFSRAVSAASQVAGTVGQIGQQFGLFSAQPHLATQSANPQMPQQQLLPQSFWDDFSRVVSSVGQVAGTAAQIAQQFGLFSAQPRLATQSATPQMPQQLLPQSFWDDFSRAVSAASQVAGAVGQIGQQFGLFGAQPHLATQSASPQLPQQMPQQGPQLAPQSFWDDIGKVASVAVPIVVSLLQARPQLPAQGAAQA